MLKKLLWMLVIQEVDLPRVRALLSTLIRGFVIMSAIGAVALLMAASMGQEGLWLLGGLTLLLAVFIAGLERLNQGGHTNTAANLLLTAILLFLTLAVPSGFLEAGVGPVSYAVLIVAAALLIGPAASLVWAGIATLAILIRTLVIANTFGVTVEPTGTLFGIIALYALTIVTWLLGRSLQHASHALHQRIGQIQASFEISRLVTATLDPTSVTQQAVRLIQNGFGYYHVGLFVLDPESHWAVLTGAAGEAAAQLQEAGHRLALGGTTAGTTVVAAAIIQKRRQMAVSWAETKGPDGRLLRFNNRLLPLTRAELVIPLQVGDRVLGALDVHRVELAPFPESDIQALEAVATQIAVALENARLFEDVQQRHQELSLAHAQTGRRARYLEVTAELARAISSLLDPQELLDKVVHLIGEGFGFYHVGVFLVDEGKGWAVLQAANSEGGQRMLARGHKLRVGEQGIVGWVTQAGQPRTALDVGVDAIRFDNPDLPDARSEVALPLKLGDRVIGALDVQSVQEAAFSEEGVSVLQALADQITIAIENVRLFQETQRALEEMQAMQRYYVAGEWQRLVRRRADFSAEYRRLSVAPLETAWSPEMETALTRGVPVALPDLSVVDLPGDGQGGKVLREASMENHSSPPARAALAVPIKLRGEVIGVLDLQEIDEPRHWTDEEVAMVTAVADQVALALENARLLEETQRRAERERLAGEITSRIRAAGDVDGVLRTTVQEMRRALRVSHGAVRLGTETYLRPADGGEQMGGGDN